MITDLAALAALACALTIGCGGGSPAVTGSGGRGSAGSGGDSGGAGVTEDAGGDDAAFVDASDASDETADDAAGGADGAGACAAVVENHPSEGNLHLTQCTATTYLTNPPSSGNHYPVWADYKIYDQPVPWGFLVHDLEHGAVVISYRCAAGCNVDLTAVRAFVAGLAPDDVCLSRKLITVVPDPNLDVAFAASAWTWTLRADCFDPVAFGDFVAQHYAHGLERVCSGGADYSSAGWCP